MVVNARRKRGKAAPTEIQSSSDPAMSNGGRTLALMSQTYAERVNVLSDPSRAGYRTPESMPLGVSGASTIFGPSRDAIYVMAKEEAAHYDASGKPNPYGLKEDGDVTSLRANVDGSALVVSREGRKWQARNVETGKLLERGTGAVYDVSGKNDAFESATLLAGNSVNVIDASGEVK